MKDHEIAHLVNELRGIAVTYACAEQLRSRISECVNNAIKQAAPVVERQPVVIGNLYRTAEDQLEIELVGNPKITDGMSLYTAPPDLADMQAQLTNAESDIETLTDHNIELDRDNTRLTKELDDALDRSDKLQETISQLLIEIKYLEARLAKESKK
jgi:predicted nuclease with TOPRIM domain